MIALAVGALALAGAAEPAGTESGARSAGADTMNLIFTGDRDGDFDVYSADVERATVALTRNLWRDRNVVVSPSGRWLAFDRGLFNGVLMRTDARRERRLRGSPITFSRDGRLLAVEREDSEGRFYIDVVVVGTRIIKHLGPGRPGTFSPDGRFLSYSNDTEGLIDLRNGKRRVLLADADPIFSPRWTRFAFLAGTTEEEPADLVVADVARPRTTRRVVARVDDVSDSLLWLSERKLAFEPQREEGHEVDIVDVVDGTMEAVELGPDVCCLAWSPRRDRFAYQISPSEAPSRVGIGYANGTVSKSIEVGRSVSNFEWSPRGDLLAIGTFRDILVADPSGQSPPRRVAAKVGYAYPVVWAPDESAIGLGVGGEVEVVRTRGGKVRRLTAGGNNEIAGWARGPRPANASARRPRRPPVELADVDGIRSRGKVLELAAEGAWVAAIIDASRLDCEHVVAWSGARHHTIRFQPVRRCESRSSYSQLSLQGSRVRWMAVYCGNYCYVAPRSADLQRPGTTMFGEEDTCEERCAPRPAPPRETKRGVAIAVSRGTITLRRLSDGYLRKVRPPGGAVDAELEAAGLYYAYNSSGRFPGRVVFVPFSRLFD
jgi:Tol biopolymer transport system component